MPAIVKMLRNEIERLNTERSELVVQRSQVVATLDGRIADIDQRLGAAERMLTTYVDTDGAAVAGEAGGTDHSLEGVEMMDIPVALHGHRLRPSSKKAKIIRATKALLQASGAAGREEIVGFLQQLGIMVGEKNPKAYLSVILWHAREIFETNGTVWYLRDAAAAGERDPLAERRAE